MKPSCFAPFYNLNFDVAGNVTVCCYNKSFVLGNVKNNSIAKILESPILREIQQSLAKADFSKGCFFCEQNILAGNGENALLKEYDQYYQSELELLGEFSPKSIELEISNNCNLACVMCYGKYSSTIRKKREGLPPVNNTYPANFAEQLLPYLEKVEVIKFLGGEPFLNPYYFEIWEEVSKINPSIKLVVTTNGTVFNKKIEDLISRLNFEIIISTDSISKENFEKIRVGGNFENFYSNLIRFKDLQQKKGKYIGLTLCPLMVNYSEIPEIIEFCQNENLSIYFNTVVNPIFHSTLYKEENIQFEIIQSWKSKSKLLFGENGHEKLNGLIALQESQIEKSRRRARYLKYLEENKIHPFIINQLKGAFYYDDKCGETNEKIDLPAFERFLESSSVFFEIGIKSENKIVLSEYISSYPNPQFLMKEILTFDIENMIPFFATGTSKSLKTQMQYQFP